jgi:hypothetical protein
MSKFSIKCSWLPQKGESELDLTLSKIFVSVGDRIVTEYKSEHWPPSESLEIPAYYLAEWIAENWWPLLWEPRKNEDAGDDQDFLDRHCILAAQHGFALPRVLIVPQDRNINVSASARYVPLAGDVRFPHSGSVTLPRADIESELKKFVQKVVSRLGQHVSGTALQELWKLVEETALDEQQFCKLMGALGLSPYVSDPITDRIEKALEDALSKFGERLVMDLCLASTPDDFVATERIAHVAYSAIESTPASDLGVLSNIQPPPDSVSLPAWHRGSKAAERLREKLQISNMDPKGGDQLFELLGVDPGSKAATACADSNASNPIVVGIVQRDGKSARIALVQEKERHRRFAAARGIFAAWASEQQQESRFLTPSVTRDQQANRAFAAEILAPYSYIRSQAKRGRISQNQIYELASDFNIGSDVVWKQAQNKGLQVDSS